MTDRETLSGALERLAAESRVHPLTLGEVADGLSDSSFSILCAILALPMLAPVSLGPLATVGGLTLAALAIQILSGKEQPSLPQAARRIEMPPRVWEVLLRGCSRVLDGCLRFSRPRYAGWVEGLRGRRMRGSLILAAGLLMAVPLFGLPLNNSLPALAIMVVCLAELEDDGAMLWVGAVLVGVSAVYILGAALAMLWLGSEAFARVF